MSPTHSKARDFRVLVLCKMFEIFRPEISGNAALVASLRSGLQSVDIDKSAENNSIEDLFSFISDNDIRPTKALKVSGKQDRESGTESVPDEPFQDVISFESHVDELTQSIVRPDIPVHGITIESNADIGKYCKPCY